MIGDRIWLIENWLMKITWEVKYGKAPSMGVCEDPKGFLLAWCEVQLVAHIGRDKEDSTVCDSNSIGRIGGARRSNCNQVVIEWVLAGGSSCNSVVIECIFLIRFLVCFLNLVFFSC